MLGGGLLYLIKKASEISGVSVRTLQHYDKIGLLSPKKKDNGYRYYSEDDMSLLQTILYYKYLGFSLNDIKNLIHKDDCEILGHLENQLKLMNEEKNRLLTLISTLEKTIESRKRGLDMEVEDKFKGFTYEENLKYKDQAVEKYGSVVEEAYEKQKGIENQVVDVFNEIFFSFADNLSKGIPVEEDKNIELARRLHQHIRDVAFNCSLEVFSQIAYGYVYDDEFKKNIDKFGEGTAQYVCDSVQAYVNKGLAR